MRTLDGYEDHLVNIQSLPNYKLPFQRIDAEDEIPPSAAEPGSNLRSVHALEDEEDKDGEDPTNFGQFNNI